MSYQNTNGGFIVRQAPGSNRQQSQASSSTYQEFAKETREGDGDGENVRASTAARHMWFGLIEIVAGLFSNLGQVGTTVFSLVQIQLGVKDQTFATYGPLGGLGTVAHTHSAFIWVAAIMAVGSQILLQAGCQILSYTWKKEQRPSQQEERALGLVRILLNKEVGWFFTGVGFVLDAVGDLGFAFAFGIPWYVCIFFGLIMYGLSSFVLYDGDERFHYAYPLWWKMNEAKKVWRQAALEKARLLQGVSRDGRALVSQR